jgi:hypothetical protein
MANDTPRTVCGFIMAPMVAAHFVLLNQIESPLLLIARAMMNSVNSDKLEDLPNTLRLIDRRESETEGEYEARMSIRTIETFFIFVRPLKECRELLDAGRERFTEAAMAAIADRISLSDFGSIQRAIGEHFAASLSAPVQAATQGQVPAMQ